MKKLFFVLTLSFFLTSTAFSSDVCSDIQIDPNIKFTSSYGKLTIDKSKSKEDITLLAKQHNYIETGLFANGLSTVNINFDISLKTYTTNITNNDYCILPEEINIFLGLDSPIIYLSKELVDDSCEYDIVLRHEKTHQHINKKTIEYYLPLFKNTASTIIKSIKPIHIKDLKQLDAATNDYIKTYNQKLNPLVDFIKKEIFEEQKKLDNPNNYKYENSLCN